MAQSNGKKGRSILLVLVTSAIMLFVLAGLLIRNAADTATSNAKKSVGATVTLSANREAAFKKMRSATSTSKSSRPKLTTSPVKLSDAKKSPSLATFQVTMRPSQLPLMRRALIRFQHQVAVPVVG